ncbi:MAG: penicillin-binding protein 2 [Spirochaetales bacterium]|nr:penicillin-binding protein 2 [Spirochaetales bacterium]
MGGRDSPTGDFHAPNGRIIMLMIIIAAVFSTYAVYLFSLQIIKGLEYQDRARLVSQRIVPVPSQRGEIYDRNADVPLVINIDSYAIDVIPAEVPREKIDTLKTELAKILKMPLDEIQQRLSFDKYHLYQSVEIAHKVPDDIIFYIAEHLDEYPGVTWHKKPIRSYLETGSIAHVIGYVNDITTEELQVLYNKGYKPGDVIGKRGVEKKYDMVLRGKDGARYRTVDVRGRGIESGAQSTIEPELGMDVVLTIDRNVQRLAEQALGDRIGSVVVLKPDTGEILALVSYPWYDPNLFYQDRQGLEFARLSLDPSYPFLNRAIQSSYPPASTFKLIMTTALIDEKALDPEMIVECNGFHWLGDRKFDCWLENGHGEVNLFSALAQSCNIYFQTVGLEYLGIDIISDYMHQFGLGEKTGVDLAGEVTGIAPSPIWKEKAKNQNWVGGDTYNTAIGQGFTVVTPIQLANVVAMIVNDGVAYYPHILKEIRDPVSGEIVDSIEPRVLRTSTIQKSTFNDLKALMRGVITDGTAKVVITTDAVEVAGKTGTGEVGLEEHWDSWFAAYGPYDAPAEKAIVVVVLVEAVNEWEWWAPKAANVIFQGLFAGQDYEEAVDTLNLWYLRNQR